MQALERQITVEDQVISQLENYNTVVGRIKVAEKYPIGNGMYLTEPFDENDKLQPLHRQLRKMSSHMYLTNREQKLEEVANAHLTNHPVGVRSQAWQVEHINTLDENDERLLRELAKKIRKVAATRGSGTSAFEAVLERVSELQDLQQQKQFVDDVLAELNTYKPHLRNLLVYRYIEDRPVEIVCSLLTTSRSNYKKWREAAISEYARLAGLSKIEPKKSQRVAQTVKKP